MAEPEISHRCPECGASMRVRASFCPQCGKPQKSDASASGEKAAVTKETTDLRDAPQATTPAVALDPTGPVSGPSVSTNKIDSESKSAASPIGTTVYVAPSRSGPKTRSRVRNMVADNVRPRVERLRHASSIVLEEASIDPSVRFLLVAAVLFIAFIVLLVLSLIK